MTISSRRRYTIAGETYLKAAWPSEQTLIRGESPDISYKQWSKFIGGEDVNIATLERKI